MKNKARLVSQSLRMVFQKPAYIGLAVIVALLFFLVSVWGANYDLLVYVFTSPFFDFKTKSQILWRLLVSFKTNFPLISLILTISLAFLLGLNIATLIYYLKKRVALKTSAGASLFGVLSGILGIGCAACGSVIFSSILGVSAALVFINLLPFKGFSFGVFGIFSLLLSTYLIAQKIGKYQRAD